MKNPNLKYWLIDMSVVVVMAGVAVLWLPLVTAWCLMLSSHLGRTLIVVHSIVLGDLLPHVLIGCLLGCIAAWLIQHQKPIVAILPSFLFCVFYIIYYSFGPSPYPWGRSWLDLVLVADWLLLVSASFLCAWLVLKRRQSDSINQASK